MKIKLKDGVPNDTVCNFMWDSDMKKITDTFGYSLIMKVIDTMRDGVEWNPETEDLIIDEHTKQSIMEDDVAFFFDKLE